MKNKGFTLIELLVTIAIVGILAAMAMALFDEYRRKAYDAAAISQASDAFTSVTAASSDDFIHCEFNYESEGYGSVNYGAGSLPVSTCLPGFTKMPLVMLALHQASPASPTTTRVFACHRYASVDGSGVPKAAYIYSGSAVNYVDSSFTDGWVSAGFWSAVDAECSDDS